MLYGKNTFGNPNFIRDLKDVRMNIPIQGGFRCVKHNNITDSTLKDNTYSNLGLFYETFMWKPSTGSPGVPVSTDPFTGLPYSPETLDPDYRPPGYCDFKPVITNNHGYYSALDEITGTGFPIYDTRRPDK